jgi:cell division septation protein DedD
MLVFLAGVAVCGVFFSLGFLVGYNERSGRLSPATEHLTTSNVIPPTVNPPLETVPIGSNDTARSASEVPPALTNPSTGSAPSSSSPAKTDTTARVEPPATSPSGLSGKAGAEPAPAPTSETRTASGGFIVQVTAMRAKPEAESVVRVLRGRGYHALLVPPQHAHAKDSLYRVQVGPFASRESAEKMLTKLKHEGFRPFIRR